MTTTQTPPLHHGAVGNGRILALVAPDTSVDWLCLPRFDSPSFFGRLLDANKGGALWMESNGQRVTGQLSYVPNTNVLQNIVAVQDGTVEVVDFAPWTPRGLEGAAPLEFVRLIRPRSGQPRISLHVDPRPDYARAQPLMMDLGDAIRVEGAAAPVYIFSNAPIPYLLGGRSFELREPTYIVLTYGVRDERPTRSSVEQDLSLTVDMWRAWAKTCALPSFASEAVLRSALCLKLHVSADTGAIIAAATTSIPEAMGTQRTWDYRYCWLRDAAFVVEALRRLSHLREGERFMQFLRDVAQAGPLQPVYAVDGGRALSETMLPHLAGYGGNGFVRIGNQAHEQKQHDLQGELMLCLETLLTDPRLIHDAPHTYLPLIERLVGEAMTQAELPDTGIWEFRTILKHYTFSQAMCFVAADRGALLAAHLGRPDLAQRYAQWAAVQRNKVLTRGYNAKLGFFTQALDGTHPDASNLLLPTLGLLEPKDPRFISTVEAYGRGLTSQGLMLRYRNEDDFGDTTSAFTMCSFWWAEALAHMGRLDEAVEVFQRLMRFANPVGLFSEDVDPHTGQLLGNFPQAYTHVGLIHAATTIAAYQDLAQGNLRAWR